MAISLSSKVESFPPQLLNLLKVAGELAEERGQALYMVGGAVRDLLLGKQSLDIDLVVEGDAMRLARVLATLSGGRAVSHARFGTATLRNDYRLDFAAARSESYSHPGALPTVRPANITDDLFRRDFTVNAMAISLSPGSYGELVDPYAGRADLQKKLIRVLHDKSFVDDATRILRALRYEQRLGFTLEPETARLLRRHRSMINTISGDRLRHELELILREERPELVLRRAFETGALQEIHRSLRAGAWLARKFELVRHRQTSPRDRAELYLSVLMYNLPTSEAEEALARLNMPGAAARAVRETLALKQTLTFLAAPHVSRALLYNELKRYGTIATQANAVAGSPRVRHNLELFLTRLSRVRALLSSQELMKLGVPAGPDMGIVREVLVEARLDGKVRTRRQEEKLVRHWLEDEGHR